MPTLSGLNSSRKEGADDRALPQADFDKLNEEFRFSVDVAAASHNAKLDRFYTEQTDGLSKSWKDERVYCNPPYSKIAPWVEKAWAERLAEIIVLLLPANRTEQGWWQEFVEPFRDKAGSPLTCRFLPGRYRFLKPDQKEVLPNMRPPFGCVLLIWNWRQF